MKKILALVSLLLIAACAAPTNEPVVETNRATNRAAETSSAPAMTETDAIAKEKAIWDTIKNKDYETFGSMLASDQIEVLDVGVHDKAASISGVRDFEPSEVSFADWKFLPIDKDAVVLVYTANVKGKFKGKEFPPTSARASSAWVNRDGKWLAIYHQECEIKTAPPPPAAGSSPAKTSSSPGSTSPPASTAVTTSADPIANEQAIWAALKSKNYDGFADALAPEAIEVEPTGVFDKAGTVKAVSGFDFSKAEVSDFKSVPINANVALVTYLLKIPKEDSERHSTIWARRNGKWLAVFHHGTPISKAAAAAAAAAASPAMK